MPGVGVACDGSIDRHATAGRGDSIMSILELAGVSKHFGAIQALIDVSLTLNPARSSA